MNIWIRILLTVIKSFFQSKIQASQALKTRMTVGPTEADLRYVGNARYLLFMEIGRLELMLRTGILRHVRRQGWAPLVASQSVCYASSLRRFQRFTLTTRLVACDEKWFFIEHKIERKGRTKAFGVARCCFRGPEGVVPPAKVFASLKVAPLTNPVPQYALLWTESEAKLREAMETL